ncbi:MAG: butyrate kinase [Oscillospiraceae bacterium]|nr:butyrate kinase [Oscillospiraceae bacterium]
MNERILVINPGSTSTKLALFVEDRQEWKESISHTAAELSRFPTINDQLEFRRDLVLAALEEHNEPLSGLAAVVSRGGNLPPVHTGAYLVDEYLCKALRDRPVDQHAANIGAAIALQLAEKAGVHAYIYDALTVDEMDPVNTVTGLRGVRRPARGHNLNTRAAALHYCAENGKDYNSSTVIVAHLGGGITVNLHKNGRMCDVVMDEEGPFSPERAGGLPVYSVVEMCFSGEYDKKSLMKHLQRAGGLLDWFGTGDLQELEVRMAEGDEEVALVYEAMALNTAKAIGKLAVTAKGSVDAIVLTGGMACSSLLPGKIAEYCGWIAPVVIIPGENEMNALAEGTLRVLRGEETADLFRG